MYKIYTLTHICIHIESQKFCNILVRASFRSVYQVIEAVQAVECTR